MSPISPVAWKVITVAALLVAGGLLYACPSRSQCPLVQMLSLGRQRHAPSRPEASAQPPAAEPAVATTQSEPDVPPQEGATMPTLESETILSTNSLNQVVSTLVSLLRVAIKAVDVARIAMLLASANPRLESLTIRVTWGNCCCTHSTEPSVEALSTTTTSKWE